MIRHPAARRVGRAPFLLVASTFACALLLSGPGIAQDDAGAAEDEEAVEADRFEVAESVFDDWAFRHGETAETTRAKLERDLVSQIEDVDRVVKLTGEQRAKLLLAGGIDVKRYFDDVEAVRKKFLSVRKDRQRFGDIWREIHPLQSRIYAGIFDEDSIFRKSLRKTLSPEQAGEHERSEQERRAFLYRAEVECLVALLEDVLPLEAEQRERLLDLVIRETRRPRISSEYDHYVVLWQLSRLPEDQLKPIFDETQWKVLTEQFRNMRDIGELLKKNGKLSFEGDPPPGEGEPEKQKDPKEPEENS